MSYLDAPATKLANTFCCCCGKKLGDSLSIELGIGPECRDGNDEGLTAEQQTACNKLTHAAAVAAQRGDIEHVRAIAEEIRAIGLSNLADKVSERFVNAERLAKIVITQDGNMLRVQTPYKRSAGQDFVNAWRNVPGRRWSNGANVVPVTSKPQLWALLKQYFPGEFGKGPNGVFKIPGNKRKKKAA
jgi:hypothetical protein